MTQQELREEIRTIQKIFRTPHSKIAEICNESKLFPAKMYRTNISTFMCNEDYVLGKNQYDALVWFVESRKELAKKYL